MAKLLVFLALLGSTYSSTLEGDCTVYRYSDIALAAKTCDTLILKDIVIPAKTTLAIELKANAKLVFDGRFTHEVAQWTGDLVQISGTNVNISGTSNHLFDGLGAQYWKGGNDSTILRPHFLKLKLINSVVQDLKLKNCPNNCVIIRSTNLVVSNINIDNHHLYPGVAGTNYAKNNVGFDVSSSTNLRVENSVIINQGDCAAVNGGINLVFENLDCRGSGLSLTTKEGQAINIQFLNSKIAFASDAIHIQTSNDVGDGSIINVLYQNIKFVGINRYAVDIQQNDPNHIINLTLENVSGSMTGSKSEAMHIICSSGGCINFVFTEVIVTGARQKNICQNEPISC